MATGKRVDIEVKANVSGEESVGALGHTLDSTGTAAKRLGTDASGAAGGVSSADAAAKGLTATSGKLRDGLESVSTQLASAKAELLALVGVGVGVQGVKDISALADSYKNLEARIELTTGKGKAFDTTFEGVFDVAKRTNSAVEETGVLVTKLADAGKPLGVSLAESLKLAETINQSIQLSGASAEGSKASIQQLVQGLQSGVLRGDEFNSVMEQSPRLAKALADGLGVTTGELRKMAEAGQLTSATVIKALQNQSDAVQSEFGKLPATVGRAMTNLTTSFTAYVGEADKAHGYTAKLAGVIDALAGNLGTVATVMIHSGQALGALKLLNMAQDWLTASAAIKATAVSTEMATAATVQSTAAKAQNTTATAANTAAQVTNAAAWNGVAAGLGGVGPQLGNTTAQAGAASRAFGVVTGAVGGLMRAFAPLLALDIALHFKEYGTAIGEWTAKLMGAKDRSAELAAADKRATEEAEANSLARKKQALATKEATDRTFGLTKEGSALIVKFDELRTKGDSASSAIASIGKDFDLSNVPGIRSAASVLDKLAAEGKLSASEFQEAWALALKGQDLAVFEMRFRQGMAQITAEAEKASAELAAAIARGVSGKELKVFEDKAREALGAAANEAKRFEQVVGAELQAAVQRTGLDMAVISGGMGKAAQSAINDTEAIIKGLDKLKAQGVDTAQVLTASIGKGIATADSQAAIDAVRAQIEAMGKAGQLAKPAVDALLVSANEKAIALKDALDKAAPGVNSLAEAMKNLGITSDQSLKNTAKIAKESYDALRDSGTASLRELQEGFKAYAEKAIAANGGVASAALKVEAAMAKVSIQTDGTGKAIVTTMAQGAAAIKSVEDAYHQLGLKTPEELKKISEANAAAWDKVKGDSAASLETLKAAFNTYAQSAIAASGSVGSEQRNNTQLLLQQEAAVKGLAVSFDAEGKIVVQTQAEAAAAINGTTGALKGQKAAVDEVTTALEAQNAAIRRKNAAEEEAIALENKRLNRDSEGFALDDQGKRRVVTGNPIYSERGVYEMGKEKGLTEEQALQVAAMYTSSQKENEMYTPFEERWMVKLDKVINDMVLGNARAKVRAEAGQDKYGQPLPVTAAEADQQAPTPEPVRRSAPAPAPAPAPTPPVAPPASAPAAEQRVGKSTTNLTINVAAGVSMSSRADVERIARAIMPAINDLNRKGARSAL